MNKYWEAVQNVPYLLMEWSIFYRNESKSNKNATKCVLNSVKSTIYICDCTCKLFNSWNRLSWSWNKWLRGILEVLRTNLRFSRYCWNILKFGRMPRGTFKYKKWLLRTSHFKVFQDLLFETPLQSRFNERLIKTLHRSLWHNSYCMHRLNETS